MSNIHKSAALSEEADILEEILKRVSAEGNEIHRNTRVACVEEMECGQQGNSDEDHEVEDDCENDLNLILDLSSPRNIETDEGYGGNQIDEDEILGLTDKDNVGIDKIDEETAIEVIDQQGSEIFLKNGASVPEGKSLEPVKSDSAQAGASKDAKIDEELDRKSEPSVGESIQFPIDEKYSEVSSHAVGAVASQEVQVSGKEEPGSDDSCQIKKLEEEVISAPTDENYAAVEMWDDVCHLKNQDKNEQEVVADPIKDGDDQIVIDEAESSSAGQKRSASEANLEPRDEDPNDGKRRCGTECASITAASKRTATVRDMRRIADDTGERYQRKCCSCHEELQIMKDRVEFWRNTATKLRNAASELDQSLMTLKTSRDPNFKRKQRTVATNTPIVRLPVAAIPNAFPHGIRPNSIATPNQNPTPQRQPNPVRQQQSPRVSLPTSPRSVRSPQQFGATPRFPVPGVPAFSGPRNPVSAPRGSGLPMRPMNGRGPAPQAVVQNPMRPQIRMPNGIAGIVRPAGGQDANGYQNGMNSPSLVRMQASRLPVALVAPNAGNQIRQPVRQPAISHSVKPSNVVEVDLCSDDEDDLPSGSGNSVPQRQPLVPQPVFPSSRHMNGNASIARDAVPPFPLPEVLNRMMNNMIPKLRLEVRNLELVQDKGKVTLAWDIFDNSRPRDLSMVANYELFAYQKVGAKGWDFIRSMNAMNLPMACVVTLVRNGLNRRFYFTVRAVLKEGSKGPCCDHRSVEI